MITQNSDWRSFIDEWVTLEVKRKEKSKEVNERWKEQTLIENERNKLAQDFIVQNLGSDQIKRFVINDVLFIITANDLSVQQFKIEKL